MLDFFMISTRSPKKDVIEIYPKFIIKKSFDLMIRGGDFYAIWVEELGLWSIEEQDALQLIDRELDAYAARNRQNFDIDIKIKILHMWDAGSGMIDSWHKYCQRQMRDSFHMLDEKLIFSNSLTTKEDYASKKLSYPLEEGSLNAYNKLMSTLYSDKERHKIEWSIGSIVSGDSKKLHKFMVLYGAAGTGKSTVLTIIQQLFKGYYSTFDAKALGSSNNSFALEAFRSNPLVAIQHDGDLSKIEDNTRLNSLVSHEVMSVNEKFKSAYDNDFKCFLFMGTNKPVKITDAKSGLIRRLIDVSPSGNKLNVEEYKTAMKQVEFELGAIAYHCQKVYLGDPNRYDDYIPIAMLGASNDFYNFVIDSYHVFKKENGTSLKAAWEMYKTYCDEAKVSFPFSQRVFKEELKNYFREYKERFNSNDGTRVRSYYEGFRTDKFEYVAEKGDDETEKTPLIQFDFNESIFDKECAHCLAQYATAQEKPSQKWSDTVSTLSELDSSRLHYVKVPDNHIVIDFDLTDDQGNKSLEKNIKEASKWPPTYAEISKSGNGVHLHYVYPGEPSKIGRLYEACIEIKVPAGNSSLRRKLTKCNNLPIASITSGLPLKGDRMINHESFQNEKGLRTLIKRNLNKEIHPGTKPSIDFIHKILEDAYNSGLNYDITDMHNAVLAFAANSTHQADYCIKLVTKMRFKSENEVVGEENEGAKLVFFDVEVFPNLFIVGWKTEGIDKPVVRMINPTPAEIEELIKFNLIGFNCRRYDNHILYARLMGYSNEQLYNLSRKIVNDGIGFFGGAYNLSYTDIYDFSSTKQSLKKFEIELGIHHQELGLPWDQPVPEELWTKVVEYCATDVVATEAVFKARKVDFLARQILADVAGGIVNDTTNALTTKIVFGNNRKPQEQFNYRNMGVVPQREQCYILDDSLNRCYKPEYRMDNPNIFNFFDVNGMPYFPGYKFECGKSSYRGEEVGEGGYVYAEPGMYGNVTVLDVTSMHPSSIVAENLFGDTYTSIFKELLEARIAIKHKDFTKAKQMLNGSLAKYLTDENTAADLARALKIAINSVYGLTAAKFENPFKDSRNKDNIVAKRGSLFMINLKHEVQKRGFTVAHIKTDSIKIPDATAEVIDFVLNYGRLYGYTFEHECTYERMCLVNDAVYIARDSNPKIGWTATGTQFAVPYVFKKLFSNESIGFDDMCETKAVTSALYLDMNEGLPEGEHNYRFIGRVGRFCPVKEGSGGGILLRETVNKKTGEKSYVSVTGTKGFRWLEAEMVKGLGLESSVEHLYYEKMVNDAVKAVSQFGDFEWFTSDEPYHPENNGIYPF